MENFDQVKRVISNDGTEISGQVKGQGPPLVLLPAGPGDSITTWKFLLPFLTEHFTCYLVDTRGRGLSAASNDHSPERLLEDISAFIKDLGSQVGLLEWGNTLWALCSGGNRDQVAAVAAYEPGLDDLLDEGTARQLEEVFASMGKMVEEGQLNEAVNLFIKNSALIYTEKDLASGAPEDFWMNSAPNLKIFFQQEELIEAFKGPGPSDPSLLTKVDIPVLLLVGSETREWFKNSVHYLDNQLLNSTIHQVAGATHFGPYLVPEEVAGELIAFFRKIGFIK